MFGDGTVPTLLTLSESVTHANGTLQLTYVTAGAPDLLTLRTTRKHYERTIEATSGCTEEISRVMDKADNGHYVNLRKPSGGCIPIETASG